MSPGASTESTSNKVYYELYYLLLLGERVQCYDCVEGSEGGKMRDAAPFGVCVCVRGTIYDKM